MKAMAAELNMYQAQVNEYKYEIERLTRELQDMKTKVYLPSSYNEVAARFAELITNHLNDDTRDAFFGTLFQDQRKRDSQFGRGGLGEGGVVQV